MVAIVLGGLLPAAIHAATGMYMVPVFAFFGGWATTLILYRVASLRGQTSIATMLLAGIVLGALAGAATGGLVYLAAVSFTHLDVYKGQRDALAG